MKKEITGVFCLLSNTSQLMIFDTVFGGINMESYECAPRESASADKDRSRPITKLFVFAVGGHSIGHQVGD